MRYRKQKQAEEQDNNEVLIEELVHKLAGGQDTGAPEILPEVLQEDDERSNKSIFGWNYTPLGLEACRAAGEVSELYGTLRQGPAVRTLLRVLFTARGTRFKAICWSIVLVVTTLFNAMTGTWMFTGQYWVERSAETFDAESFWFMLPLWVVFTLGDLVMDALQNHSTWELRMILQRQLHFALAHSLFTADSFYHLRTALSSATPETLLCEDAFILVKQLMGTVSGVIRTVSSFLCNAWVLYSYHPRLMFTGVITAPVLLVVLGKATPYTQEIAQVQIDVRGALHFILSRVQSNAEEIALAGGGASELHSALHVLEKQRLSLKAVGWRSAIVETFIRLTSFVLYVPILWILAEDVITRGTLFSEAMMYFGLCNHVMFGWTSMVSLIASAAWANMMAERMLTMMALSRWFETLSKSRSLTRWSDTTNIPENLIRIRETNHRAKTALELQDVELRVQPSVPALVRNLSFGLAPGESMLVLGETGIGKSTLLRSIQGLCMMGSGTVQRCRKDALTCVPQKPFMYRASLRENLLYPWVERSSWISDDDIWKALEAVNLKKELANLSLDKPMSWHDILSLGQQQRFGFARALLKRDSQLVLLDEATSALDLRNERIVYGLLRDRFPCYVSAAHRRSVQQYHTHVLVLERAKEGDARSTARFMAADQCDFARETPLEASAPVPEGQPDAPTGVAGEDAPAEPQSVAEHAAEEVKELLLSQGPQIQPPTQMLSLARRILFDIIVPIVWRRAFWRAIRPYLFCYLLAYAVELLAVGVFLLPVTELRQWSRDKLRDEFWSFVFAKARVFVPLVISLTFALRYTHFVIMRIVVDELQVHFVTLYFERGMFYRLLMDGKVQDPAGRFTMWDFNAMVEFYLNIVDTVSSVTLGNFALALMFKQADSPQAVAVVKVIGAYMVVACIGYIVAFYPAYPYYTKWIFESTRLHDSLVHVHGHAEAVALLQGGDIEKRRTSLMLDKCMKSGQNYIWMREYAQVLYHDAMFERVTKYLLYGLVLPLVIKGDLSVGMGVIITNVAWKTVAKVLGIAMVFVGSPEGFGSMSRVWELVMEMNRVRDLMNQDVTQGKPRRPGVRLEQEDGGELVLELRGVTLRTPSRLFKAVDLLPPLLEGVSLKLAPGERLVVTGPSGIGKTSLIRMVAGIWRSGSGTVRRASDMRSFFVAQRPYVCIGTLRHQLLYPAVMRGDVSRERLEEVLRKVQLEHLLTSPGLGPEDEEANPADCWWSQLSLGEVQRIAFARVLLKEHLRVAFLDEATSALSPGTESVMYRLLQEHTSSYVSVAHRPEAQSFHSHVLVLSRGADEAAADWRVLSIEDHRRELGVA